MAGAGGRAGRRFLGCSEGGGGGAPPGRLMIMLLLFTLLQGRSESYRPVPNVYRRRHTRRCKHLQQFAAACG
eukprot:5783627-Alexandrium_andersonii.AAC.1